MAGFNWDDGNRAKCLKHGVSLDEIESAFASAPAVYPDQTHSLSEERWQAIGRTAEGRAVFVVFTLREGDNGLHIRPLSARYMHAKEVRHYDRSQKTQAASPSDER